jgi:carbon storage regulator
MLVLSRQRDETIMIGDDIEITIVDIRGDKVRLGITAPATIPVHRKEVYEAIQRENREAARVKMEDLQSLPKGPIKPPSIPPGLRHSQRPGPAGPGQNPPAPNAPGQPQERKEGERKDAPPSTGGNNAAPNAGNNSPGK